MIRFNFALLMASLLPTMTATAASESLIGSFLPHPWLVTHVAMDQWGAWVYCVETDTGCPGENLQQLSRIRTDGTGYEVLVPWPVLATLEGNSVHVSQFRV